jgi:hypothetical protein
MPRSKSAVEADELVERFSAHSLRAGHAVKRAAIVETL